MSMRTFWLVALSLFFAFPVAAQETYPSRPVKLVAPVWEGEPQKVAAALAADRKRWSDLARRAGIQSPN